MGCASGETSGPIMTFGDPSSPMMSVGMSSPMDDGDATDSDDSATSGQGTASDGPADPEGEGSDSEEDGEEDSEQPASGMYSDCLSTAQCVGLNTCVTIFDMAGAPFDGFCTLDNCMNPTVDCQPSPGGEATPICFDIALNGSPASTCALDCTGGKACPAGMICYEDDGAPICA